MTRYNKEMIEKMKKDTVGKKIINFEYSDGDDCFLITFEDNSEMAFRFMADLIHAKQNMENVKK